MTRWDWLFWGVCGLIAAISLGIIAGHIIVQGGIS